MKKNLLVSAFFTCALFYCGFSQQDKARLNHTAIYVMDVKTSAAFYQNIIGLDRIPPSLFMMVNMHGLKPGRASPCTLSREPRQKKSIIRTSTPALVWHL